MILSLLMRFGNQLVLFSPMFCISMPSTILKVPLIVLVKMLHSTVESTITVALNALIVHERSDPSSVEQMTEAGGIDALLDLLRSHQCEEASGRLLDALFNNARVREKKVSKYAIAPLAQYLLDPQGQNLEGSLQLWLLGTSPSMKDMLEHTCKLA
ncbi:hypothetical protein V6N13_130485 [Hibiscus sabdariffa]